MQNQTLGEQELEVLRYVSDRAPITIGEAAQHFADERGLARTTILTVMERLRKKGFLTRKKEGGIFHYSPAVHKSELLRGLVQDFVEKTLHGSVSPFVAYLAKADNISDSELVEIKRLVAELETGRTMKSPGATSAD